MTTNVPVNFFVCFFFTFYFYSKGVTIGIVAMTPQASQTHDSRNRSNIYDLSTRIE